MAIPVTSLTAFILGKDSVSLAWVDDPTPSVLYLVYAGTSNVLSSASAIGCVNPGVQSFKALGLTPGTTYYFWIIGYDAVPLLASSGPVLATTTGTAGTPGVNIDAQIIAAARARCSAFFSSDFKELAFPRTPQKTPANVNFGYGIIPGEAVEGQENVLGSYCLSSKLELILFQRLIKKNTEFEVAAAEQNLMAWGDRAIKDFRKTKLYAANLIVNILTPTRSQPEYLDDAKIVVLKFSFPVVYRQSLGA